MVLDSEPTADVTAVDESDPTDDADDTGTITHTVSGGDYAAVEAAPVAVRVVDDEDPQVKVEFDRAAGIVAEAGEISFSVTLSKDPERTITIPISVAHHGADIADYTLAPTSVTFDDGSVLSKPIALTAVDDAFDDDGESVTLSFTGLTSGERQTDNDLSLHEANRDPRGISSDGELIYVLDSAKRLFAYRLSGGTLTRVVQEEFSFGPLLTAGDCDPRGIWSDGEVVYVADEQDDQALHLQPARRDRRAAGVAPPERCRD